MNYQEIVGFYPAYGQGGAGFTPLSLGVKLLNWWHPNDASQVTESGGVVTELRDKGTKGNDMTGSGGGNGPTISNGEITFDGSNDQLYYP